VHPVYPFLLPSPPLPPPLLSAVSAPPDGGGGGRGSRRGGDKQTYKPTNLQHDIEFCPPTPPFPELGFKTLEQTDTQTDRFSAPPHPQNRTRGTTLRQKFVAPHTPFPELGLQPSDTAYRTPYILPYQHITKHRMYDIPCLFGPYTVYRIIVCVPGRAPAISTQEYGPICGLIYYGIIYGM